MCIRDRLYIVQVGTTLEGVEETLRRFLLVLVVMAPIALVVSLVGGWFLAGRALRPVDSITCLLYTSPSPRDRTRSRMPSSA